jgi:ribosome-associated protein
MQKQFDETVLEMARILDGKKASDIVLIDVSDQTIIADYFIVCSGRASTHIQTLADELVEEMGKKGIHKLRMEGYRAARWIVIDFGEILVHIFHNDERKFYDIERLWVGKDNSLNFEYGM